MDNKELSVYMGLRWQDIERQALEFRYQLDGPATDGPDADLKQLFRLYAEAVYNKARCARDKYGFHPLGWATPDWKEDCQVSLAKHTAKGDPRDNTVLEAFMWFHGWPTAPASVGGETDKKVQAIKARLAATPGLPWALNEHEQQVWSPGTEQYIGTDGSMQDPEISFIVNASEDIKYLLSLLPAPAPSSSLLVGGPAASNEALAELERRYKAAQNEAEPGPYAAYFDKDWQKWLLLRADDEAQQKEGQDMSFARFDDCDMALLSRDALNALPALLARVRTVEAHSATLLSNLAQDIEQQLSWSDSVEEVRERLAVVLANYETVKGGQQDA
jgi:hypothetical protein